MYIYPYIDVPLSMRPHFEAIFNGEYDIKDIVFKEPPLILDVGANMGAYTIWVKNRFPECRVLAFEPCVSSFEIYKKNTETLDKLDIFNVAISSNDDENILYKSKSNPGANSLHSQLVGIPIGSEIVKIEHPKMLPLADIIKVDTEGCEKDILDNYLEFYSPTVISYEWHRASDGEYLFNLLKAKGYSLKNGTVYSDQRGVYNWLLEGSSRLA